MNIIIILLTILIVVGICIYRALQQPINMKQNYKYSSTETTHLNVSGIDVTKVNGKVKITVDGRNVDPDSEEGKRIMKTTLAQMDLMGEEIKEMGQVLTKNMDEMFESMDKMFKNIFK